MSTNISSAASPTLPLAGPGVNGPAEGKSDMPGSLFFQFDHATGSTRPDLPADLFFSLGDSISRAVQDASNQSPEQAPATDPAATPTNPDGQSCQPAPADNTPPQSCQPDTPPVGSDVTWNGGTLNDTQLQVLGILNLYLNVGGLPFGEKVMDRQSLERAANSADAPADLRAAAQAMLNDPALYQAIGGDDGKFARKDIAKFAQYHPQVLTWNSGTLNDSQLEITSVLARHKDKLPLDWQSIQDKANDPSTPPDLKAALQALANDPALFVAIGSQGDGKCGGKIKAGDVNGFIDNHPQVEEYNRKKAEGYVKNYIPSDAKPGDKPSAMTQNDALRELYRYSDYLPKKLDMEAFQRIVDGDSDVKKAPPQVIAAAEYFLQNRNEWASLNKMDDPDKRVGKSDFLQRAASAVHLSKEDLQTVSTINSNLDVFFKDGQKITRDRLAAMSQDESLSPAVRNAAKQLLQDPLLYGLINNANSGYKTKNGFFSFGGPTVDSGVIGKKDFEKFMSSMTDANKTVQARKTHPANSEASKSAVADMGMGMEDQPDIKAVKKSGGALKKAMDKILTIYSKVMDIASQVVGALGVIPGLGEIADALSMGMAAGASAAKVLSTLLNGGSLKKALAEAGINLASAALGAVAGPEARVALKNGLTKMLVEKVANTGIDLAVDKAKSFVDGYLQDLKGRLHATAANAANTVNTGVNWVSDKTKDFLENPVQNLTPRVNIPGITPYQPGYPMVAAAA
ncbi:HrpF/NolX family T3SS translocon protein [Ralstonia pseudosolanacearum]|uniref:HrpF/NolX family T3SS translocon protein n=8 Tax=Ralstonia pseudosolanacearum TaxID=1310165 RepID=UPI003AAD5A89